MPTQTWLDLHPEYAHWQHQRGEPLVRYVPLAAGVPEERPAPLPWRPAEVARWRETWTAQRDDEPWS